MKTAIARALMVLTDRCLGEHRREWASAMHAEFEIAVEEQRPLAFAMGCWLAALREMPRNEEGRFVLVSYALVLCVMIPMAARQIGCATLGFQCLFAGQGGLGGAVAGSAQEALGASAYRAAVPSLTILLLLLGMGQVRIAWAMLERDWSRVLQTGALALAVTMTLVIFMTALFLDVTQAVFQASVLAMELAVVALVAWWYAQIPPSASPQRPDP
jgi:hypothetical protein